MHREFDRGVSHSSLGGPKEKSRGDMTRDTFARAKKSSRSTRSHHDESFGARMNATKSSFPVVLSLVALGVILLAGCGSSGQTITIQLNPSTTQTADEGQVINFLVTLSNDTQNRGVTWSFIGTTCSGDGCGKLSNKAPFSVTYTAPPSISSAITATLQAQSVANTSVTATVTINIVLPPSFTTTTLPNGSNGIPYSQQLQIENGVSPFTYTLNSGSLPACLNLNKSGAIVGTPCGSGTSSFVVTVTDYNGVTANSTQFTVSITPAPALSITSTSPLGDGFLNVAYNFPISTSGGVTPFTWSMPSGNLPAGLMMNSRSGQITGTPTATGTSTFTLQVQDSTLPAAQVKTATFSITIENASPLKITPTSLPPGQTGSAYNSAGSSLQATGGVQPYIWTLVTGQLPPGLTLAPNGVISGTPILVTTSYFTVEVTDSETPPATATSQQLSIAITAGSTSNNGLLSGRYSFIFNGFDKDGSVSMAGTVVFDGKGNISGGGVDSNRVSGVVIGAQLQTTPALPTSICSCYSVNTDGRGKLEMITQFPQTQVNLVTDYQFVLDSAGNVRFFQNDSLNSANNDQFGTHGSGIMKPVLGSSFSLTSFSGNYAFVFSGEDYLGSPAVLGGVIYSDGNGTIMSGTGDYNDAGTSSTQINLSGGANFNSGNKGLASLTFEPAPESQITINFTYYFVSPGDIFFQQTDTISSTNPLPRLNGEMILQPPSQKFDNTVLKGASVASGTGVTSSGNAGVYGNGTANVFAGLLSSQNGDGTVALSYDENNGGTITPPPTQPLSGTYTVATNGRVTFCWQSGSPCANLGSRVAVAYLTGPGQGFLMGADAAVTSGILEQQVPPQPPATFSSDSSVQGDYALSTFAAAENQVNNVIGEAASIGDGSVSGTVDEIDANGTSHTDQSLQSTINSINTNGRGILTTNLLTGLPVNLVFYVVSPGSVRLISTDSTDQHPQLFLLDY